MSALKELVRSLAVIIIFTSFIEMLLPNSKMRNYVRLVLGLFVVVIILNPVLAFLGSPDNFTTQAWIEPSRTQDLENILNNAQEISAVSQQTILEDYTTKIEQQIAAIVKLIPEISNAQVMVRLKQDNTQNPWGDIDKVVITAQANDIGVKDSGKENSWEDSSISAQPGEVERRIQAIIGDFYGLASEQVYVKLED